MIDNRLANRNDSIALPENPIGADYGEERLIRIEDAIICGRTTSLHSEFCRIALADASNPFAIARLMHANGKMLDDLPTVCVNSLEMAQTLSSGIDKDALSLLSRSRNDAVEIVVPARDSTPEILGDGYPYVRIRIFEDGIMHEIITHVARPLAMYVDAIEDIRPTDNQRDSADCIELCSELRVENAITVLFDQHEIPVVIDSAGKTEDDITGIVGIHTLAEQQSIPEVLKRNGVSRYRPKTPMLIADARRISMGTDIALQIGVLMFGTAGLTQKASIVKNLSPTADTIEAAARLYSSLKAVDNIGLHLVLLERLPADNYGSQINERLRDVAFDIYGLSELLTMCS